MDLQLAKNIEAALRQALPDRGQYFLHEPQFEGNEWKYVKSCIDDGWVSSAGAFVDRFEADLARYTGLKHAVVCVNGTAALHIALKLAGVGRGDEVLTPALTFVATANAISYCDAAPLFVDSSLADFGVDAFRLRDFLAAETKLKDDVCINNTTGKVIRAIVPVHVFGHPCRMDALKTVCDEYRIAIVEDATEALGTRFLDKHIGGWGLAAVLSFNGNKIITTGGGGAILTNDRVMAERAKHITTTGKTPHLWAYYHDEIAYNYRMPNINAALGCAQLEALDGMIEHKRTLADRYTNAFSSLEGVQFVHEPADSRSNYWLNAIMLDADQSQSRDDILKYLTDAGIHVRPVWELLSDLPMYQGCQRADLTQARSLAERIINIPSSADLGT